MLSGSEGIPFDKDHQRSVSNPHRWKGADTRKDKSERYGSICRTYDADLALALLLCNSNSEMKEAVAKYSRIRTYF